MTGAGANSAVGDDREASGKKQLAKPRLQGVARLSRKGFERRGATSRCRSFVLHEAAAAAVDSASSTHASHPDRKTNARLAARRLDMQNSGGKSLSAPIFRRSRFPARRLSRAKTAVRTRSRVTFSTARACSTAGASSTALSLASFIAARYLGEASRFSRGFRRAVARFRVPSGVTIPVQSGSAKAILRSSAAECKCDQSQIAQSRLLAPTETLSAVCPLYRSSLVQGTAGSIIRSGEPPWDPPGLRVVPVCRLPAA